MHLTSRQFRFIGGALAGMALAAAGTAAVLGQAPAASPTAPSTLTDTPTAVATPTPLPDAAPIPEKPLPPPKSPRLSPAGPVAADPVVVHTGDGDCLNVRNTPGTQFAETVLFCAPEGQVLWLTGEQVDADGEAWREALGLGWVATRYTAPLPAGEGLPLPAHGFAVSVADQPWGVVEFAHLDAAGNVLSSVEFEGTQGGIGWPGERISPGGEYIAISNNTVDGQVETIVGRADGAELLRLAAHAPVEWNAAGQLLLTALVGCDRLPGCQNQLFIFDAPTGSLQPLGAPTGEWIQARWRPSGTSVVAVYAGVRVAELALDGSTRDILTLPIDALGIGEFAVSPDGSRILSATYIGPARVIDLETGAVTELPRAPQRTDLGGRCGTGGTGLVTWLDDSRVIYHENAAERGENGITVVDLTTGGRRVIPVATVQDIRPLGASSVSLTTVVYAHTGSYPVTWIMDVDSGRSRPLITGQGAVPIT